MVNLVGLERYITREVIGLIECKLGIYTFGLEEKETYCVKFIFSYKLFTDSFLFFPLLGLVRPFILLLFLGEGGGGCFEICLE